MTDKRKNIPLIRFKGFTDAWEQRKLGDYVVDYIEKTTIQNQYPVLTSSQQKGIILQEEYFASRQVTTDNNIGYFVLPRGYFTFRSRSDNNIFVFNRNDIVEKGIISYFYPVFTLKNADSDFFLNRINNGIQRQLSIQAEGTGQHVLSLRKFKNIVAMFPVETEQQRIGTFFKQLDDTIALHQRQCDLLAKMKKSYLQKMFPKNGESKPKIRFAGFTSDWEPLKLGEVFTERSERSGKGELISVTINSGVVKANELNRKDNSSDDKSNYKKVKIGDIAYNSMRMWQGASGYSPYDGILSPAYTVISPKENVDSKFFAYDFKRYDMIQTFRRNSQGLTSDTWNLKFPTLKSVRALVPSFDEQQQVSNFFKSLDNTITLHQRQLEALKNMKKSLLQKMFI